MIVVVLGLIIATMSGTAGATNADRPSPHRHLEGMAGMASRSVVDRNAYYRQWRRDNPDKVKAIHKRHAEKHPEAVRGRHRKYRYGVTAAEYARVLAEQGGHCAICPSTKRLVVDHDHATGRFRAILCNGCNVAIAHLHENIDTARAALAYLEKHNRGAPSDS